MTPSLCLGLSPISLTNPIGKQCLSGKQQAGHMWISFSADETATNQRIIGIPPCQPVKGYLVGIPCQPVKGYPPVNQSRDTLLGYPVNQSKARGDTLSTSKGAGGCLDEVSKGPRMNCSRVQSLNNQLNIRIPCQALRGVWGRADEVSGDWLKCSTMSCCMY